MSRAFTSSDPAAVAEFCARPFSQPVASFTSAEITAMRTSLEMAQTALAAKDASLQQALAQVDDMRRELAAERAARLIAEVNERRWVGRMQTLEARLETMREVLHGDFDVKECYENQAK